ncbi:PAS domain S-box protein, partial [Candidatus Daviesbacteria bacterium]|nr:PAS domain S-box protein [Candidatus Daviesbacteria bacterium]
MYHLSIKGNLRFKLITILTFLTLLPIVLGGLILLNQISNIQTTQVNETLSEIATSATRTIQDRIDLLFDDFGQVSVAEFIPSSEDVRKKFLNQRLKTNASIIELSYVNPNGQEEVKVSKYRVITDSDLIDLKTHPDYPTMEKNSRQIFLSFDLTNRPILILSYKLFDQKSNYVGLFLATVDPPFQKTLNDVLVGSTGEAYIISHEGIVIAHKNPKFSLQKQDFSEFCPVKIFKEKSDQEVLKKCQYKNYAGVEVLGKALPIFYTTSVEKNITSSTSLGVAVEWPAREALATVTATQRFILGLLLIFIIISILLGLLVSPQIVKPIERLRQGVRLIASGNLANRINLKTGDEIEELANEFNNMASILQSNINTLTDQNKLLTSLRSIDKALISTLEIEPLSQAIIDLVTQKLDFVFGVIALIDHKANGIRRIAISKSNNPLMEDVLKMIPIPFNRQVVPLSSDENLLVKAVKEKKSFYTENIYDIQRGLFSEVFSRRIQQDLKFKGIFIYPLITGNQTLGTIYYASNSSKEQVSQTDLTIMEEFASEAARALENALLYQDLKKERTFISAERNKLEVVLSGVNDAVLAVSLNKTIVTFNKAAEKLTGYSQQEALGKPVSHILKLFDRNTLVTDDIFCPIALDRYEGIVYQKEKLKLVGNNKESFVSIITAKIKEGAMTDLGCILTLHDITSEKQLEEMKLDFVSMAAHELRTPLTS